MFHSRIRITSLVLASVAAGQAYAATDTSLKLGGFVDAQVQSSTNPGLARGFLVNDGALYLSTGSSNLEAMLDLPFRLVNAGSGSFEFATLKTQAYVASKYSNGLRWKLGQFDTSYGFEANDTVNVVFTRQGSVKSFTDPFVHAGFQLGYDITNNFAINALIGAPSDTGTLRDGSNPEFGLQAVLKGDFRMSAGALISKAAANQELNYYIDTTIGITAGALAIDAELNYQEREGQTTPDKKSELAGATGSLLQFLYAFNDMSSFGVRGEYITHVAKRDSRATMAQNYLDEQYLIFIGPQFNVTNNMKMKVDYSYQHDEEYTGSKQNAHGLQAALVYKF